MFLSKLIGLSVLTSTGLLIKKTASEAAAKIWERISFSVPSGSTKVNFGFTSVKITSSLQIDNQNDITVKISGLFAIAKYPGENGELIEIGRTEPNNKVWTIGARQKSVITDIVVNAGTINTIKAITSAFSKEPGKRVMITFSGEVNGLPLSYDYWY